MGLVVARRVSDVRRWTRRVRVVFVSSLMLLTAALAARMRPEPEVRVKLWVVLAPRFCSQ